MSASKARDQQKSILFLSLEDFANNILHNAIPSYCDGKVAMFPSQKLLHMAKAGLALTIPISSFFLHTHIPCSATVS
jgi:hypothetical protein